jgi:hypothetical protein
MTFGTARDLSSQVVAIPMTSFGMLMNSPDSEFQRIGLLKSASILRYAPSELPSLADFPVLISPDGVSQSKFLNNL